MSSTFTADEAREMASVLDLMQEFCEIVLTSDTETYINGEPISSELRQAWRDQISGDEMQERLRAWATELEQPGPDEYKRGRRELAEALLRVADQYAPDEGPGMTLLAIMVAYRLETAR